MKRMLCVLTMLLAVVCFADSTGMAPVNPAFLKWKARKERREDEKAAQTNQVSRRLRTLSSQSNMNVDDEDVDYGFVPEIADTSYLANINNGVQRAIRQEGFASSYDPRSSGRLTPVKNQNPYGTCWAHATMGSLESWLRISENQTFDFSENNLANLHGFDWGFDDGGNASMSSAYLLRWAGPVLESQDPYANPGKSTSLSPSRHVQRIRWIAGKSSDLDNDDIKDAIMKYGALYASYYHSSSYYNSSYKSYYHPSATSGNHAVAVVGWDDNYSKDKFSTKPSGNGAYIVRNSWGTSWGDGGYFYVSYYDSQFARSTMYAFCSAEATSNYSRVYQYDTYGFVAACRAANSTTAYGAAVFTAGATETIGAVGFYALVPNTSYVISIRTGATSGNPGSGTLASTQSGLVDDAGFVTVPLDASVSVASGSRFAVILKVTTPGYSYPLATEILYAGYSSAATASSGQTFISANGGSWTDFATVDSSASFCLKAYVKTESATKKLAAISCYSSDNSTKVASGKTKQFTCRATYSDGSEKEVTPTWSITSGGSYGSISASGLFAAASVTSGQGVGVRASYTEGGVTKTSSFTVTITVAAPEVPTGLTATDGAEASCVRLNWTPSNGATSYAVYRGMGANLDASKCGYHDKTSNTKYADTDATPGVTYTYRIRAVNDNGSSAYSIGATGWRALAAPETVLASDGTSTEHVHVTWSECEGAGAYCVYRAEVNDESASVPIGGWRTEIGFDDDSATPGVLYYYWVKAAVDASGKRPSALGASDSGLIAKLVVPESLIIKGSAALSSGATETYSATVRYSDGNFTAVTPTWSIGSAKSTAAEYSYTAPVVSVSQQVPLNASCEVGGLKLTAELKITVSPVLPDSVTAPNIVSSDASGVSLSWAAVAGASSYVVYRGASAVAAEAKQIGTASGCTYLDDKGTPGESVYYFVAAVNAAGTGARSSASAQTVRPFAAPTGVTASVGTYADKIHVDWTGVDGLMPWYRVYRAASQNGAKTALGSWKIGTGFDDKTADAGVVYWYFVRAATSSDGANTSAYSAGAQGQRKLIVVPTALTLSGPDRINASGTAVYAASARFSDGTISPVAATWTVKSGSGATITADGALAADAVMADATIVLEASFTQNGETVRETKSVLIIAPKVAKVAVTSVKATSRWPWRGIIDIDYTVTADPPETKVAVSVSGYDNDHLKPVAASTLSGEGAGDAVTAGDHRISWDIAADHPGFNAASFTVDVSAMPASLAAPKGLSVSEGGSTDGITLSWEASVDAESYQIWRSGTTSFDDAEEVRTVEGTGYTDTDVTPGTRYYYWVAATGAYGVSEKAMTSQGGYCALSAPTGISASDATSADEVVVSWQPVVGATSYEVWRGTKVDGSDVSKLGVATELSYPDVSAVPGNTYYYFVKAVASACSSGFGAADSGMRRKIATGLVITGDASVKAGGTATYTCTAKYNDNTTASVTSTWSISDGSSYGSITSAGAFTANGTGTARSVTVKASYSYNGVTVQQTKTISITTFTVSIAFDGNGGTPSVASQTYTAYGTYGSLPTATWANHSFLGWYTAASGGTQVTAASTVPSSGATLHAHWQLNIPSAPTNVSATDGTTFDKVTITWTASSLATSYEIWRHTSNSSGSATRIGTSDTTSYSDSTAVAGTTYYYWVKAVGSGGTSGFSASDSGIRLRLETYTLTFNKQGGSGGTDSVLVTNGVAFARVEKPTRDGYAFGGYFTAASFGGTQYYTSSCTGLVGKVSASRILYAGWIQNVVGVAATVEPTGIRLSWSPSDGALKYRVYDWNKYSGSGSNLNRKYWEVFENLNIAEHGGEFTDVCDAVADTANCTYFDTNTKSGNFKYYIVPFRDEKTVGKFTTITGTR